MTDHRDVPGRIGAMVEHLRERGYARSPEVAEAFLSVARHQFVPGTPLDQVYSSDVVVPTHFDADGLSTSSSSAPSIMATMLEQLRVRPGIRVLEIGAGTGYNAGLLAHLVGPGGRVVSVELDEQVAAEAEQHLRAAGIGHVRVVRGDGWLGAADAGPFDRVILTVGAWEISRHWFEQLIVGGVLVMPLWLRPGLQVSVAFARDDAGFRSEGLCLCGFMRLRGPHAGPEAQVVVPGWADRVDGVSRERRWIASVDNATPERLAQLQALLRGPVEAEPGPIPAAGWTLRLAFEDADVIALSGRKSWGNFAFGLFAPDRPSLAVFDAGKIVSFGDPFCAVRLRHRLSELAPLTLGDLDIRAVPHPAGTEPGAWVLERPTFDLVVRDRRPHVH